MRFVYVLEDDAKFQKDITDAIQSIDPKIQVRLFKQLDQFVDWIKLMMSKGPEAIELGGEIPLGTKPEPLPKEAHQLVAIVSKIEFLGVRQIPLLKKTRDQFIRHKICTQEDPTAFVLTTFDEPAFQVRELRDRILNNVIYKPFDTLILTQHLTYAIDGRHPPSKYSIANQKASAVVEMLKDAKLEAISEFGFITRSDRIIDKKGMVSKYYGGSFAAETKVSLMASVLDSKPDPKNPNEFICSFSFFGVSPVQIMALRKKIKSTKQDYEFDWEKPRSDEARSKRPIGVVIIDEVEQNLKEVSESLSRRFKDVIISKYGNYSEFLMDLDPKLVDGGTKAGPKALPADKEITFVFEPTGKFIMDFVKPSKDAVTIFGLREADLKNQHFWSNALGSEMMSLWQAWLKTPTDKVLVIAHQGNKFYLKPASKDVDKTNKNILVKFTELNADQRNQYLLSNSKIPTVTDFVLVSHRFLQPGDSEMWTKIKAALKTRGEKMTQNLNPSIFIMASKDYSDSEMRQLGTFVTDILYRPIDRGYLAAKMKLFCPELKVGGDEIAFHSLKKIDEINIASPVPITEISEAGLVLQYYRSMSLGAFRGFVLWMPYEVDAPKLIGTCNYTEESSQKGIFNNHFVFFGMTDHFLKAIRIWIRDYYILSKEQG